jgi:predicted nucleic acid-binding protein
VAAVARYLVDKSALARLNDAAVYASLAPLIEAGLVATCAMIEFEVLWSTRTIEQFDSVRTDRQLGYEWLAIEDVHWRRALDVQRQLWVSDRMRSVPLPDLLIAAVAEAHNITVVHYDADYDTIASLTGQLTQWVAPKGSVS